MKTKNYIFYPNKEKTQRNKTHGPNLKKYLLASSGFTLIEIITTIIIVSVLAIVGATVYSNIKASGANSVRSINISFLKNSIDTYSKKNDTYPEPNGNKQYYTEDGTYSHTADGAFGVSGFISSSTFPKEIADSIPRDPLTKSYYAYAKRLDGNLGYTISSIMNNEGEYLGYIEGKIGGTGKEMKSLVKEFAGPNFVINGDKYLPYDPYEMKLIGKIAMFSGSVSVNTTSIDSTNVSNTEISEGNQVKVSTGGLALIYLSDGTEIRLGDTTKESVLDFSTLKYTEGTNDFTNVVAKLSLGEIWVKAPALDKDSLLQITTPFIATTVRGTVFGVDSSSSSGTISLINGKIQVEKTGETYTPLFTTNTYGTGFSYDTTSNTSYMEVLPGASPISLNYISTDGSTTDATTSGSVDITTVNSINSPLIRLNSGVIPRILMAKFNSASGTMDMIAENVGGDSIEISGYKNSILSDSGTLTIDPTKDVINLSGVVWPNQSTKLVITLCRNLGNNQKVCSSPSIPTDFDTLGTNIDFIQEQYNRNLSTDDSCSEGYSIFHKFGCQPDSLIAYSPYDKSGDVFMYTRNTGILPFETNSVISTNILTGSYTIPPIWNIDGDKRISDMSSSGKIGGLTYIPKYISSFYMFDSIPGLLDFLNNIGAIEFKKETSFMRYLDKGGIFMDNNGTDADNPNDYLKYDISKLNLGDNFTIEMSVRGAGLKRSGVNYYLFGNSNYTYNAWLYSGRINYGNSIKTFNTYNTNLFSDNTFYKIQFKISNDNTLISIKDDIGNTITSSSTLGKIETINFGETLYVGSDPNLVNQWNDIIDYIKIYRN